MLDNFAKSLGFGSHEQPADPERDRLVVARLQEVETNVAFLHDAVFAAAPAMVRQEDGLVEKAATAVVGNVVDLNSYRQEQAPAQAVEAAGTVISLAAFEAQRELSEKERRLAEARSQADAAWNEREAA